MELLPEGHVALTSAANAVGRAILRLRDELEAVSARCVNTAKDRDRWQEMYNSEHRSHVNAVVAMAGVTGDAVRGRLG